MYRKMLVPLDTSGFAECVFAHVTAIATTNSIPEVVLLSVVERVGTSATLDLRGSDVKASEDRALVAAGQYLQKVRDTLTLPKSSVKTIALLGVAVDEILNYIDKNGVDVVVLSSHGRSGISRWLLGSTADKLLRRSPVPVFLVPAVACRV